MDSKTWITLGLTFVTGVFAGMFLYVTTYAPQYAEQGPKTESLSITGSMYGGCDDRGTCPSFHLSNNGAYQYLSDGDGSKETGKIPVEVLTQLKDAITASDLQTFSKARAIRNDCVSYVDDIDYTYSIAIQNKRYEIDTCKTNFSHQTSLQKAFVELWIYMDNPTTTYPTVIEKGVGGWLIDRMQNQSD